MELFRKLDTEEEASFRQWARDSYTPLSPIQGIWHPVVQDECAKINSEHTFADMNELISHEVD